MGQKIALRQYLLGNGEGQSGFFNDRRSGKDRRGDQDIQGTGSNTPRKFQFRSFKDRRRTVRIGGDIPAYLITETVHPLEMENQELRSMVLRLMTVLGGQVEKRRGGLRKLPCHLNQI